MTKTCALNIVEMDLAKSIPKEFLHVQVRFTLISMHCSLPAHLMQMLTWHGGQRVKSTQRSPQDSSRRPWTGTEASLHSRVGCWTGRQMNHNPCPLLAWCIYTCAAHQGKQRSGHLYKVQPLTAGTSGLFLRKTSALHWTVEHLFNDKEHRNL